VTGSPSTAYVHIGMHKTGSTSIQMTFDGYASDTLVYPDLGNPNQSAILSTIFKSEPETYSGHRLNNRSREAVLALRDEYRSRLDRAVADAPDRNMLLSGEDLVLLEQDELDALRRYLLAHFAAVEVIGYVRPPASYMASALQQRAVGGANVQFAHLYPKYRQLFEKFDVVFGRDNVTLVKFDRQSLVCSNVVLDLASRIAEPGDDLKVVDANFGRSLEATSVIVAQRRFGEKTLANKRDLRDNKHVVQTLEPLGSSKIALHRDFVERVLDAQQADLAWIENRLGASLAEQLAEDDTALRTPQDLFEISGRQVPALGELIASEMAKAEADPVLAAQAVDFLYRIVAARNRALKRKKKER
jgi:hypothetical protein